MKYLDGVVIGLDIGEEIDPKEANQLIEAVIACFKGKHMTAEYACYVLDQAKQEVRQRARLD